MRIVIEGHTCPTWNQAYAGMHWTKRKKLADQVHLATRAAIPAEAEMFAGPVNITVTAYRRRLLDADNVPAKLYIDGLCGRVIEDDTPRWVKDVRTRCRKGEPKVVIDLVEVPDGTA